MRYYVIADVHGFYTPMMNALKSAGYFDDPLPHKLIILGDLFDRGREALAMQSFIVDLLARDAVILIRGNHEDMFEDLATIDAGQPLSHHISNGTYDTALQLTDFDRGLAPIRHYDFAEAAQRTAFFTRIIPAMLNYYETTNYVFVHGWIPCLHERSGYCYIFYLPFFTFLAWMCCFYASNRCLMSPECISDADALSASQWSFPFWK